MPANPPENMPRITPYLLYEDVASALDWLSAAFGLRERTRLPGPDGSVGHAEMELADGVVMMGCPGPRYRNPRRTGHVTQELYVYVDDVDNHFERAKAAGATILEEPGISSTATGATGRSTRKGITGASRSTSGTSHPRT